MPGLRHYANRWLPFVLFAAGFALLFRGWLFTGFDGVFGDDSDGEIAIALIHHWQHVLAGEVRWSDPTFFFPEPGTLGYTDAFFLIGVVHAGLGWLGFDTFTALMLTMAVLSALGFFGFMRLATRHCGLPLSAAAVGAFLFAFANVDAVKLIHVQSYCAMLLPTLCDLLLTAWKSQRPLRGVALAAGGGLLHAALFLTAYQTAWFFTFLLILLALLYPVAFGFAASRKLAHDMLARHRHIVMAYGAAFAIGIIPFLTLYLPVLMAGRSRDFAEVLANAPDWRDFLNVTPGNAVWGELMRLIGIAGRPNRPTWEVELAFTPTVLAIFFATLVASGRRRFVAGDGSLFLLIGVAVVVLWLLQFDYAGVRPWQAVWASVPGAGGIRYVFRSQLVANLFVCLVVARGLAIASTSWLRRGGGVAVALLLMIEQINIDWPATLSRRATLAWLDAIPAPPPGCRIFYLAPNPQPIDRAYWVHEADAMLFSQLRGMPTVSGYSSWFPAEWDMEDPTRPGYAAGVRDWARRKSLDGLCGLAPRRGTWTVGLPE